MVSVYYIAGVNINNIIFPLMDNNDGYNNHATMTSLICSKYFSGIKIPVSSINIA